MQQNFKNLEEVRRHSLSGNVSDGLLLQVVLSANFGAEILTSGVLATMGKSDDEEGIGDNHSLSLVKRRLFKAS